MRGARRERSGSGSSAIPPLPKPSMKKAMRLPHTAPQHSKNISMKSSGRPSLTNRAIGVKPGVVSKAPKMNVYRDEESEFSDDSSESGE